MSGVRDPVQGSVSEAENSPFGAVEMYLLRTVWTFPSTGWASCPLTVGFDRLHIGACRQVAVSP